jgi:hypothetical protein
MRLGIGLPNPIPGTDGATLVEWARRAEEAGFSSLRDEVFLAKTAASVDRLSAGRLTLGLAAGGLGEGQVRRSLDAEGVEPSSPPPGRRVG